MKQYLIACIIGIVALSAVYCGACLVLIRRGLAQYRNGFEKLEWARITYQNRVDDTGPLHALAVWPREKHNLPVVVVMHGFADAVDEYFSEARYWAEQGKFCLLPDMRGRASHLRYPLDLVARRDPLGWHIPAWYRMVLWLGRPLAKDEFTSEGRPDANGAELLDIESALRAARERYAALLGPDTDIIGYSGGGSNALYAAARMPYLFQRAVAFFPIVDFARQDAYNAGQPPDRRERMRRWIGGAPEQLPHHYAIRSVYPTLDNTRHTRMWVFTDRLDPVCPGEFAEEFAQATRTTTNISVQLSGLADELRWQHATPNEHSSLHQVAPIVFAPGTAAVKPSLARTESWVIAGYLLLPDVEIFLGDLQAGVVRCTLTRGEQTLELDFLPLSAPDGLRAAVRVRRGSAWMEHRNVLASGHVVLPYE